MLEVTQLMGRDSHAAVDRLRTLLQETKTQADASPGAWEIGQCLVLLAQLEEEHGNLTAAAELDESLAEKGQMEATQWHYSSALAHARAALACFKSGDIDRAMQLAEKALSRADVWADPSIFYEELIREVRRVKNERARDGA